MPRALVRQIRCIAIRTRGFREGEWGQSTPTEVYKKLVESGDVIEDQKQQQLLRKLQSMYDDLTQKNDEKTQASALWNMFKNTVNYVTPSPSAVPAKPETDGKGLYIHGDVGCGKTMLMDIFFRCVPSTRKLRIHLQAFLLDTYKAVHRITTEYLKLSQKEKDSSPDIMDRYVNELNHSYDLICFDEFQVIDPGDASLLATLFQKLFSRNMLVIFTSNKSPTFYLTLGSQYIGFVRQLHLNCNTHALQSTFDGDYRRLTGTPNSGTFLYPNTEDNTRTIMQLFKDAVRLEIEQNTVLESVGKSITVPLKAGGVALFSFHDLCGDGCPKSPSDYQVIVEQFHTIFIIGIPVLSMYRRNEARRFINLIDEMYQYKVKLVCTAEADIDNVFAYELLSDAAARQSAHSSDSDDASVTDGATWRFTGEEDVFAFKRVESRLSEMATHEYLLLPHLNYIIDDIDMGMLFTKGIDPDSDGKAFIEP
eukprot:TRINITY_DN16731_c0_g1_i1.p1 TRINITY_DN16731_c0_g1~~TRINITY_DN16731_c0_g1_i1.p1  ORF type:complete len:479 (+),score=84.00 TRINITY_DN16731_c0_g1_i1:57-1493(+)